MKRLVKIVTNKKGASIILVLCFILMVLAIGASILFAAFNSANAQLRHQSNVKAAVYTNGLAARITDMVTEPYDPASCWWMLAQKIYDVKIANFDTDIEISDPSINFDNDIPGLWVNSDGTAVIGITLTDISANVTQSFLDGVDAIFEDGVEVAPAVEPIPEIAKITAAMTIEITVKYGKRSQNVLYAEYLFYGETIGEDGGIGKIVPDVGGWELQGYYRR